MTSLAERTREEVLDLLAGEAGPRPLTTAEVAAELELAESAARGALADLAERGDLETRTTDGETELWWATIGGRPDGHQRSASRTGDQSASRTGDQSTSRTDDGFASRTDDPTDDAEYQHVQFRELVDTVADYAIFLLDVEGYVRTWNEGAERIKGYAEDEIVGEHFSTFYTDEDVEAGRPERNLQQATEQGRIEDEGWRVRKDGSTFWANVVITALHDDDGDLQGYAKVTRDMTERHAYEQQLRRERERLEFLNRIVRHNVLNGLNLVNAHAQLLQDRLPEDSDAQHNLATIRTRVKDLSALIDSMRTFMDVVISDDEHETEPVPLRPELEAKIGLAQDVYPDARIEARDLPAASIEVIADDLIQEVFENVISNAVDHNDKATPRVAVWTTETTHEATVDAETGDPLTTQAVEPSARDVDVREWPAVAVHVADNGPGISDGQKATILDRGVSEHKASDKGFGLYLVREMMEAYGGRIDVRDPDPDEAVEEGEGVVFDLVFLRAGGDVEQSGN